MTSTTLQLSECQGKAAYSDTGQGEPVVLIHGVGMQSAAWAPQIEALSKHYRVIAIDMPGHGGSDPLPEGAELQDFVNWFAEALTALNIGPVNLIGHSMGALIAGGLAIEQPALIRRVALLNGVYRRSDEARAAVVARAKEIREGGFDLATPLARWFGESADDQAARMRVADWLSSVDLSGYATAYAAFACGDNVYADRYCQISCPFLALTGEGDQNSSAEMSKAMAGEAQNGQSLIIQGHRHMVNLTAPAQVNAALMSWLKSPLGGRGADHG